MIEGLKLRVTSAEIRKHCLERAEYHTKRAGDKEVELPAIKDAFDKIKAGGTTAVQVLAHMNKSGYHSDPTDVIDSLEKDIKDHRNKTLVFKFFGEHLFDEDYTLMETDLQRLEIVARW